MSIMRPIRPIAAALLVASLAVAGCAKSQSDQNDSGASQRPPVTAPSSTAPRATEPSVTAPPATRAPTTSGGATGSEPAVLADGRHPVYLKTVDPGSRKVTFDLIQLYFGDDAAREAAKDHQESPPPNDYYIRNVNPRLRTLPVRSEATITVNTLAAGYTGSAIKNVSVSLPRLEKLLDVTGSSPPFWITVHHDQIVKIAEQYIP
jgi:hypothetical protein